ncbi:MAG: hypothetical protein ACOZCO_08665 [Bacteroidota bacterium]
MKKCLILLCFGLMHSLLSAQPWTRGLHELKIKFIMIDSDEKPLMLEKFIIFHDTLVSDSSGILYFKMLFNPYTGDANMKRKIGKWMIKYQVPQYIYISLIRDTLNYYYFFKNPWYSEKKRKRSEMKHEYTITVIWP